MLYIIDCSATHSWNRFQPINTLPAKLVIWTNLRALAAVVPIHQPIIEATGIV
jgi:hypothetical protein